MICAVETLPAPATAARNLEALWLVLLADDTDAAAPDAVQLARLESALDALLPAQRTTLELLYLGDVPARISDVASDLAVPKSVVRQHEVDGVESLKTTLADVMPAAVVTEDAEPTIEAPAPATAPPPAPPIPPIIPKPQEPAPMPVTLPACAVRKPVTETVIARPADPMRHMPTLDDAMQADPFLMELSGGGPRISRMMAQAPRIPAPGVIDPLAKLPADCRERAARMPDPLSVTDVGRIFGRPSAWASKAHVSYGLPARHDPGNHKRLIVERADLGRWYTEKALANPPLPPFSGRHGPARKVPTTNAGETAKKPGRKADRPRAEVKPTLQPGDRVERVLAVVCRAVEAFGGEGLARVAREFAKHTGSKAAGAIDAMVRGRFLADVEAALGPTG